jgi:hypothetical protein
MIERMARLVAVMLFIAGASPHAAEPQSASSTSAGDSRTLNIASADVALVLWVDDEAVVRLTPSATDALERFTRSNIGRTATVSIDGIPAVRAVVMGVINSGSVSVRSPSPALRARLEDLSRRGGAPRQPPAQNPPRPPDMRRP